MMSAGQICDSDAAYVFGALSVAERREFEKHLSSCNRCQGSVAELASTNAALSVLSRDDAVRLIDGPADDSFPPGLIDEVVSMERARKRRGKLRTAGVAATSAMLGAAAAAALFVVIDLGGSEPPAEQVAAPQTVDFARVGKNNMLGSADLKPMPWGTSISLKADYEGSSGLEGAQVVYQLVAVHGDKREVVGSWTGTVGEPSVVSGASHMSPTEIDELIIQMAWNRQDLMEAKT